MAFDNITISAPKPGNSDLQAGSKKGFRFHSSGYVTTKYGVVGITQTSIKVNGRHRLIHSTKFVMMYRGRVYTCTRDRIYKGANVLCLGMAGRFAKHVATNYY